MPKADAIVENFPFGRRLQPDHMAHQGAFTASAAAHNDKNIAAVDCKSEIPLDNKASVSHGEVFYCDMGLFFGILLRHYHIGFKGSEFSVPGCHFSILPITYMSI